MKTELVKMINEHPDAELMVSYPTDGDWLHDMRKIDNIEYVEKGGFLIHDGKMFVNKKEDFEYFLNAQENENIEESHVEERWEKLPWKEYIIISIY